ncbi:MAG: carboxypeptidase-like regulatory domain-containing protein [Planctomycetota bacterium]
MSDDVRDPFDANLEELIRRAPERARLDGAARERLGAALAAAAHETSNTELRALEDRAAPARVGATGPKGAATARARSPRPVLLAAAAVLLIALGGLLARSLTAGGTDDRVENAVSGPDVARSDGPLEARGPSNDDAAAAPGERRAEDDAVDETGAPLALDPTGSNPLAAGTLFGAVRHGENAAPGAEVVVWARPLVQLPRVANAERYVVGNVGEDPRDLEFALEGVRTQAAAMRARGILVQAEIEGYGAVRAVLGLDEDDSERLVLDVPEGKSVAGTVVDGRSGVPVEGALVVPIDQLPIDALQVDVEANDELPRPYAVTDAAGRFELIGVAPGARPALRASRRGFAPTFADAEATPDGGFGARLELLPGASFEGVVERLDGTRDGGAYVIASRSLSPDEELRGRTTMTYGSAVADGNGVYRINDLPDGPHVLLVIDPTGGSGPPSRMRFASAAAGEITQVDFVTTPTSDGHSVVGTVRAADGTPVVGAGLTIGTSQDGDDWAATTTDDKGAFVFEDLDAGGYTLLLAQDDYRNMSALWWGEVTGPTEVDLALTETTVDLAPTREDGSPAASVWRLLEREDPNATAGWAFAGSAVGAGPVAPFTGLPAGRYRAAVAPQGDAGLGFGFSEERDLAPGDRWSPQVQVPGGGTLEVVVRDAAGAPVEGATIEIWIPDHDRPIPTRTPPRTDAKGRVRVPLVPDGRVELRATLGERRATAELWFDPDARSAALELR